MPEISRSCCSRWCNIFSIISSERLKANSIRFRLVKKRNSNANSNVDVSSLIAYRDNIYDDDGNDLLELMMTKGNGSRYANESAYKMFWTWWLLRCKHNIGAMYPDDVDRLMKFFESTTEWSDRGVVRVDKDDGTIVDVPVEMLSLLQDDNRDADTTTSLASLGSPINIHNCVFYMLQADVRQTVIVEINLVIVASLPSPLPLILSNDMSNTNTQDETICNSPSDTVVDCSIGTLKLNSILKKFPKVDYKRYLLDGVLRQLDVNDGELTSRGIARIHMIVSDDAKTKFTISHENYETLIRAIDVPHNCSVVISYELVHRLVFVFDCIECKKKSQTREARCESQKHVEFICEVVRRMFEKILHIRYVGTVVITVGKTHGFHMIFHDVNVDRCMYHHLLYALIRTLNRVRAKTSSSEELDLFLNESCTSFVLPYGRNHADTFFLYNFDTSTLTSADKNDITDVDILSPIPKYVYPFYSLKYTNDGTDATKCSQYQRNSSQEEIVWCGFDGEFRFKFQKKYFLDKECMEIHSNRREIESYRDDILYTITPNRMINRKKTFCRWLFVENYEEVMSSMSSHNLEYSNSNDNDDDDDDLIASNSTSISNEMSIDENTRTERCQRKRRRRQQQQVEQQTTVSPCDEDIIEKEEEEEMSRKHDVALPYFDEKTDLKNANKGVRTIIGAAGVASSSSVPTVTVTGPERVVEKRGNIDILEGHFKYTDEKGYENTNRVFSMITDLSYVRNTIYECDIISEDMWQILLIEYFDRTLSDRYVMVLFDYIIANANSHRYSGRRNGDDGCRNDDDDDDDGDGGGDDETDESERYTEQVKLEKMKILINECIKWNMITGVLSDIYGTYVSIMTDINRQEQLDEPYGRKKDKRQNRWRVRDRANDLPTFQFDIGYDETNSGLAKLKHTNYNVFSFCASLMYHHETSIHPTQLQAYLYYYNYIPEDTMNKLMSEFSDSTAMISFVIQFACVKFTASSRDPLSLWAPAELFKTHFPRYLYVDKDGATTTSNNSAGDANDTFGNFNSFSGNRTEELNSNVTDSSSRKRKCPPQNDKKKNAKKSKKMTTVNRDLLTMFKKYYWRPFTLNGIPYMYNGTEFVNVHTAYKTITDKIGCSQSALQDIFNAKPFDQKHGRNYLYRTNHVYDEIKTPAYFNVVLKLREITCGGSQSLLMREYPIKEVGRADVSIYDTVVDGMRALIDMEADIDRSSLRFVMTQPVVPLVIEENNDVRDFFDSKTAGHISLNIKDYRMCVDLLGKKPHKDIEVFLDGIFTESSSSSSSSSLSSSNSRQNEHIRNFARINCIVQSIVVKAINAKIVTSEELDVSQVVHAIFDRRSSIQLGWTTFEKRSSHPTYVPPIRRNEYLLSRQTTSTTILPLLNNVERNYSNQIYTKGDLCRDIAAIRGIVDVRTRLKWLTKKRQFSASTTTTTTAAAAAASTTVGHDSSRSKHTTATGIDTLGSDFCRRMSSALRDNEENDNDNVDSKEDYLYRDYAVRKGSSTTLHPQYTDDDNNNNNTNQKKLSSNKHMMQSKVKSLAILSSLRTTFAKIMKEFDSRTMTNIAECAVRNKKSLPFRLKLICFIVTVHMYKRLPKWTVFDIPSFADLIQAVNSDDDNDDDNGDERDNDKSGNTGEEESSSSFIWGLGRRRRRSNRRSVLPASILSWIENGRYDVIRWLYEQAEILLPYAFYVGSRNERRDDILKRYVLSHPNRYKRANYYLQQNSEEVKYDYVLLTLTYLFYLCSFDFGTLDLMLKLILSIEFPGQWSKLCTIVCGHRHGGKTKLLDILREYGRTSASAKEPTDTNKENQPAMLMYVTNMMLVQDEIATFTSGFKKVISESKIEYRNNVGNVFAAIYALSKLWYTCNDPPSCPYDSAVVERILHIKVDFWHDNITEPEVAQFRYFNSKEREAIYKYCFHNKSKLVTNSVINNEGSLPFVFFNRETKIYVSSGLHDDAIKQGLLSISMFYSWFRYVEDINKPVNIDVKKLPSLPAAWRKQWLIQTNPYYKWKDTVQIEAQDGCYARVPADLIIDSLNRYGQPFGAAKQLTDAFHEEFTRYYSAIDDTYNVSVDMNKLIL